MPKLSHIVLLVSLVSGACVQADELVELKTCLLEARSSADVYLRFVPNLVLSLERSIASNLEHLEILERTTEELALANANPEHDARLGFAASNGLESCKEFRRSFRLQLRQLLTTLTAAALTGFVAFLHLCFSIFHQPRHRRNEDSWVSSAGPGSHDQPQDRVRGKNE